jgi:outer membrane protein assembly factor BamB
LWEQPEPGGDPGYKGSWATPLIINVDGRDQILCGMPTRVVACDPDTGEVLWYVTGVARGSNHLMYTTPIVGHDFAVAMGGFGGPALGFTLGGSGDVTESNRKWHEFGMPKNPQRIGSGVIIGEHLFMANADNEGSLECRDLRTGNLRWEVRRTSDGPHWGSILHADGRLYANGQKGVTRVFAPNPDQYEEIAVNDLGEHTNATPAISDGEFFIRTYERLYCIAAPRQVAAQPDR